MAIQRVQSLGTPNALSQPRARKLLERPGAMRQGQRAVGGNAVLFLRGHLAEGAVIAIRPKDRIVAKSGGSSRREDKDPIPPAFESFFSPARRAQRRCGDEPPPPRRRRAARFKFALDAGHGVAKVFLRPSPSGRINARRSVKRLDAEPRIVGERNEPRSLRG